MLVIDWLFSLALGLAGERASERVAIAQAAPTTMVDEKEEEDDIQTLSSERER